MQYTRYHFILQKMFIIHKNKKYATLNVNFKIT